ncbi:MAG: hypothetical protein E6J90_16165 [Deltaproteobacteria bacterium]|nr:MAG: hypothetical protein E6J90_16165 [Deltaproteobacteria bacterium]TMQ22213.1 MAG: hypothetical protein E6J91_01640 [Deltaproteobacteria bacterium]
MDALTSLPAVGLARAIRERQASAADVVEAHLARIAEVNPPLNAVVELCDAARAQARAADEAIARGERLGPLHGMPFMVEDVIETAGVACAAGMPDRAGTVPRARRHGGCAVARCGWHPARQDQRADRRWRRRDHQSAPRPDQ